MEQQHLAIFFDCSGSLKEYQREHLLNYLLSMVVDTLVHFDMKDILYSFYSWSNTINEISHDHQFIAQGTANLPLLRDKILELASTGVNSFLILSDGNLQNIEKEFCEPLKDCPILIGAALIGAGDPKELDLLTKHCKAISADTLTPFLKVFPKQYRIGSHDE